MNTIYIYIFVFFVLGTIMGSFYNVVGYRLPKRMSIVYPGSHCPKCNKKLIFMELIPIVSYIIQLGKCKQCQTKIPVFYPIFEFITGSLFAISYAIFGLTPELLIALTFSSVIIIMVISDINYMIIPDELLLFGFITLAVFRFLNQGAALSIIVDSIIPFVILLLIKMFGDYIFKKESLGGGDIKLMLVFGIVLGWQLTIFSIFLASFIALPISLIILKIYKTNIIPFGPFLGFSALLIFFSKLDISWLLNIIM